MDRSAVTVPARPRAIRDAKERGGRFAGDTSEDELVPELLRENNALLVRQNELLAEMLSEIRAQRGRRRPSRAHLLAAIATAVEERLFTAAEVLRHAEVNATLARALDAAEIATARSLGKYLRRIEGRTIDGVRVDRIGEDRDGMIWRCEFAS